MSAIREDFQGNLLFRRSERKSRSTDPDINQILELPLHAGNIPGQAGRPLGLNGQDMGRYSRSW